MRAFAIVALLAAAAPARADTTVPTGQPLCTTADGLHAYIEAMILKDRKALGAVSGCAMVKGGLRMEVIDKGEPVAGMHVDKIRIYGAKGSGVGYTMNVDP